MDKGGKDNPVKQLRTALGISQQALAARLGRSYQSVRNYERSLQGIPADLREKLAQLAKDCGLADLAAAFVPSTLSTQLGATSVRKRKRQAEAAGAEPASFRLLHAYALSAQVPAEEWQKYPARWHDLLDVVLNSGMQDAIIALQADLRVLTNYVLMQQAVKGREKERRDEFR